MREEGPLYPIVVISPDNVLDGYHSHRDNEPKPVTEQGSGVGEQLTEEAQNCRVYAMMTNT